MKIIRQYALVRVTDDKRKWLEENGIDDSPMLQERDFIFLGEIPNMPEHCVVVGHESGRIYSGLHIENFAEVDTGTEDKSDRIALCILNGSPAEKIARSYGCTLAFAKKCVERKVKGHERYCSHEFFERLKRPGYGSLKACVSLWKDWHSIEGGSNGH